MGAALDILKAGNPPRATFIDYPLGLSTGKPFDPENQKDIVKESLSQLEKIHQPGTIVTLPHQWSEGWEMKKRAAPRNHDQRSPRDTTPRYQTEEDRVLAEQNM